MKLYSENSEEQVDKECFFNSSLQRSKTFKAQISLVIFFIFFFIIRIAYPCRKISETTVGVSVGERARIIGTGIIDTVSTAAKTSAERAQTTETAAVAATAAAATEAADDTSEEAAAVAATTGAGARTTCKFATLVIW